MRLLLLLTIVLLASGRLYALPVALPVAAAGAPTATDLTGDWQGTLTPPQATLRVVVRFSRGEKGLAVRFFTIDQAGVPPFNATTASADGQSIKFAIDVIGATYAGTLSADGKVISGTWAQGGAALPLALVRATKETAWEIPAAPAPVKPMAADANPAFDVATIKPSDPAVTSMQALIISGRNFKTVGSSVLDLLCFAYDVQKKQIVGAPDWIDKDRYDINGVPDAEGVPSAVQLRVMIRKLLADRYQLKFHKDKREMNAYVMSVAKSGAKLTPTEIKGPLPGMGMRPMPGGLAMIVRNGTTADLSTLLQSMVLDRPVVDQTGETGRYDLTVKFLPDDSQFNGHPPPVQKNDAVESFPSLFDAMQQQIGLKLEAQKTLVEVIAVDHVEKPSAN